MPVNEYYVWGHKNDRLESQRLTNQHHLCVDIFDGLLRPEIQKDLESRHTPIRVADVACGNGIWTQSLATSSLGHGRDLQVVGLDINDGLWPTEHERAANVQFHQYNMYEPPPKQFEGCFDVVNVRLVQGAVEKNDPMPVLKNLVKLLRPGGWIQWFEFDFDSPVAAEGSAFLKIGDMVAMTRPGHSNAWVKNMDGYFREAGLDNPSQMNRLPKREMVQYWRDSFYVGILHLVLMLDNEEVNQAWAACEKEREERGFNVLWKCCMATGRKI